MFRPSELSPRTRNLAAGLIQRVWGWISDVGAVSPDDERGRRFGSMGPRSMIAFPPGSVFGERWIHIGADTLIGPHVSLSAGMAPGQPMEHDPVIRIGARCSIGRGSHIVGHRSIEIGDDVTFGPYVYVTDQNHVYADVDTPIGRQWPAEDPVVIGAGSWLGRQRHRAARGTDRPQRRGRRRIGGAGMSARPLRGRGRAGDGGAPLRRGGLGAAVAGDVDLSPARLAGLVMQNGREQPADVGFLGGGLALACFALGLGRHQVLSAEERRGLSLRLRDSASPGGMTMPSDRQPHVFPKFASADEERRHRKQRLAAAFRLFGQFGFDEGVAGHITARDPERLDHFWVNPFGMNFKQIRVKDLILVNHQGEVVEGDWPVNQAAFVIHWQIHAARPDVVAAAHAHSVYGKAWSSLRRPLDPLTQDSCTFYGDHARVRRLHRRRARHRGGQAHRARAR